MTSVCTQRVSGSSRRLGNAGRWSLLPLRGKTQLVVLPAINRLLAPLNFVKKLDEMIRQAGLELTVSRLLAFSLIAGVLAALAAYTILNPIFAIGVFAIAAILTDSVR